MKSQRNIRLDDDIVKETKKICIDLDIPFSDAIEEAMREWNRQHSSHNLSKENSV